MLGNVLAIYMQVRTVIDVNNQVGLRTRFGMFEIDRPL